MKSRFKITVMIVQALLFVMISSPARAQAGCTGPVASEAVIIYNQDHHVMQYCNGTEWIGLWGGGGSGGQWSKHANGTDIYREGGNVGIGTAAPAHKLHVEGNALISGTGNFGAGAFTGAVNMGGNKITSLGAPAAGTDAAHKTYVDGKFGTMTSGRWCNTNGTQVICDQTAPGGDNLGNHTATTNLAMANNKVTGLAAPTANADATTKEYVDTAVAAASGGGGGPVCGATRTRYTGNLGGLSGADAKCVEDFGAGWRMATPGNAMSGMRVPGYTSGSWPSIPMWIYESLTNYNCSDWTTTSGSGSILTNGGGAYLSFSTVSCSNSYAIACCNF